MKYLASFFLSIVLFANLSLAVIPDKLQAKIDKTNTKISDTQDSASDFLDIIDDPEGNGFDDIPFKQKDLKKEVKKINKANKQINNTIKAIRKRLNELRQDPDFNSTTDEINELEDILEMLKSDRKDLRKLKKDVNNASGDLPFPNKKTQKGIDTTNTLKMTFATLELDLDDIISIGAICEDLELKDVISDELSTIKKTIKSIKKRLNQLFGDLSKTAEIKALQNALKMLRKMNKKYKAALKEINDLDEEDCNNIKITKEVGGGITCVFDGMIQPSGFGIATFECTYPTQYGSGLLRLSSIDPDSGVPMDFGAVTRNFGPAPDPRTLRIDPCPTSLPVCTEAVPVVRAVRETSATLTVEATLIEGGGNVVFVTTFSAADIT